MADYTLVARLTANAKDFIAGFGKAEEKLANLQGKTAAFGSKFQELGKSISGMGDKLTSKITKPVAVATTAAAGLVSTLGFKRLVGFDTAQAQLKGLGYNTEEVGRITDQVTKAIDGGMTTMAEGTAVAAGALAAGVKEGKELERYIKLVGDAAVGANKPVDEMAMIFNRVQGSGKLMTQELNMIEMGMPGFAQAMADHLADGSLDAFREMVTNGEVGSKDFLNVMDDFAGGMAEAYSESWSGMVQNTLAYIGILGEALLSGVFEDGKKSLASFIEVLRSDDLQQKATELGESLRGAFQSIGEKAMELKSWFDDLSPSIQGLITKGAAIGAAFLVGLGPVLKIVGGLTTAFGGVATAISFLLNPVALVVAAIAGLGVAFGIAWNKSETFRNTVMDVFESVREIISGVIEFVTPLLSEIWDSAQDSLGNFGDIFMSVLSSIQDIAGAVFGALSEILSSVGESFESAGGQVNTLISFFLRLNPIVSMALMALSDFGPQVADGFSQIASMVVPLLTTLGEMIGELAAAVIPALMNVFSTLIPIVLNLGMAIMDIVMSVLPVLMDVIMQLVPIITEIVTIVVGIVTQIIELASVLIEAILPVIMTLIDAIMNIVTAVAPALISILQAVISVFQAIMPVVMAVVTTVVQAVAGIISAITPIIAFIGGVISSIMSIISPIVSFVAGIITSIFSVIQPITTFVSGVFTTVGSTITGTFQMAMNFISSAISTISGVISTLSGVVSGVFNTISGIVSSVMNGVSSTITGVFSAIEGAWNGLTGMVSNIFSGISSSVETLVNQVKGFVNGVIGGVNAAVGLINKIPGVSISKIPQLYRGTDDWGGGFAYMNEGGRGELAMLPGGTQVIPHDVSMRYAREAGRQQGGIYQGVAEENINNENNITIHASIRDDRDIDKLAIKLDEKLENLGSRRRAALGG